MLQHTAHRPYPLPNGSWVMKQTWYQLLFAHWPVPAASIRDKVPLPLEIDTFDNNAWVGIVPFGMTGIRMRGLPPIPFTSHFPELNVRTYVKYRGKSGVFFFSLDAANRLAVTVARTFVHLPYYTAKMTQKKTGEWIDYTSHRTHRNAPAADFRARYRPVSGVFRAGDDTLEKWLTERYCLFTTYRGNVYRCDIHHHPWPLQHAEAHISTNLNDKGSAHLTHYANQLEVLIWPMVKEK